MAEKYGLVFTEPRKFVFFITVNRRRLGIGRNTALCMDSDCAPLQNVEVLSSTVVTLYFAKAPLQRAVLCANKIGRAHV